MRFDFAKRNWLAAVVAAGVFGSAAAHAATPSVQDALGLVPVQKRVAFDKPDAADIAKCTIKADKLGGQTGWVVRDAAGQVLRMFVDTNNDNVVDRWSYFQDGIEVYRDVDANFNGKADQYRWLNTAGSRFGLDKNEDGQIDAWQEISAEEVTAEVVHALADKDVDRFLNVLLSADELNQLGQGEDRNKDLAALLKAAPAGFKKIMAEQKSLNEKSNWMHFGGTRPGIVPTGSDGSTKDLLVYENVTAVVDTAGKASQVLVGTLLRVGDTWRVIAPPQLLEEGKTEVAGAGYFFKSPSAMRPDVPESGGGKTQELLAELEKIDRAGGQDTSPDAFAKYSTKRAELLEQLADEAASPEERAQWLRQVADTWTAVAQMTGNSAAVTKLKTLADKMEADKPGGELASYFNFRHMSAEYNQAMIDPKADFPRVQSKWLDSLEKFVKDYPNGSEASDAMLQLAIAQEMSGQEEDAIKWYNKIAESFPNSLPAQKAQGAKRRLESVGKQLDFSGTLLGGGKVDLRTLKGKVVLLHFWASNSPPCVADLATLKQLATLYAKQGFTPIGVGLDADEKGFKDFVVKNRINWPQVYEPGSLDGRPATSLGILTFPTMMLIDKDGKVLNRNIHISEVDAELKKRFK
ncbi:MAG: redoxin family protein [Pirellulales bacterium]